MADLGVPPFNLDDYVGDNYIVEVSGSTGVGKTLFAVCSERPLYLVYLDRNPSIGRRLQEADAQGYPIENGEGLVHVLHLTLDPDKLDQNSARTMLDQINLFASRARDAATVEGGTFVMDGTRLFKGLLEKERFNFSATLGDRARKGQRDVPRQVQYGETNGAVQAFINRFAFADCDALFVWEGREDWKPVSVGEGKVEDRPTGEWVSTAPQQTRYAVTDEVLLFTKGVPKVVNNQLAGVTTQHWLRLSKNSRGSEFRGLEMPNTGWAELRKFLDMETT